MYGACIRKRGLGATGLKMFLTSKVHVACRYCARWTINTFIRYGLVWPAPSTSPYYGPLRLGSLTYGTLGYHKLPHAQKSYSMSLQQMKYGPRPGASDSGFYTHPAVVSCPDARTFWAQFSQQAASTKASILVLLSKLACNAWEAHTSRGTSCTAEGAWTNGWSCESKPLSRPCSQVVTCIATLK